MAAGATGALHSAMAGVGVAVYHVGTLFRSDATRALGLRSMSERALASGDLEAAAGHAEEMLRWAALHPGEWDVGNFLHHGHRLLGRVAFARGDHDRAAAELVESARTPGSPTLASFGPNMSLAEELLRVGRREAVLEYLERCRGFWEDGAEEIDRWATEIRAREAPDFRANLDY